MKTKEMGRVLFKTLFGAIPDISGDELREYREDHSVDEYTLLDVRQPNEYERDHIPGAKLIPLPDLSARLDEVDKSKPVIAYCAIGGRSRAAAEFLAGRGYGEVYSLKGGIKAWEGAAAQGPEESGMALFSGDESLARALAIAHGLEVGLGNFYREMAGKLKDKDTVALLGKLADVENLHKDKISKMFEQASPDAEDRKVLAEMADSGMVEGGYRIEVLMDQQEGQQPGSEDVLDLAMSIEAQAMDLYMRLADKFSVKDAQKAMLELSDDELRHLKALGELREELSA